MRHFLGLTMLVGGLIFGGSARAGAIPGPGNQDTSVQAYGTDNYRLRFTAGEPARVMLKGDGDTDLDLFVYDEYGNLIASDTDDDDLCVAEWFPRWTGVFYICVVNRGEVYNQYHMSTN